MTPAPDSATDWLAVDTHVHTDLYPDPDAVVARTLAARVRPIVSTVLPSEYRRIAPALRAQGIEVGLGHHPMVAHAADVDAELAIAAEEWAGARWISEVGLDGFLAAEAERSGAGATWERQYALFDALLALGVGDKILSLHARDAVDETFARVADAAPAAAVWHWFPGDPAAASRALDLGHWFSVNPMMLAMPDFHATLRYLPAESLVLESDGPQHPADGSPSPEPPALLPFVAELAAFRGADAEAFRAQLLENTTRLEAS